MRWIWHRICSTISFARYLACNTIAYLPTLDEFTLHARMYVQYLYLYMQVSETVDECINIDYTNG